MGVFFVVAAGVLLGRRIAINEAEAWSAGVRHVADAMRAAAAEESREVLRAGEIAGRDEGHALVSNFEAFVQVREAELEATTRRIDRREADLSAAAERLAAERVRLDAERKRIADLEAQLTRQRTEA